jgi:hypothetical protein
LLVGSGQDPPENLLLLSPKLRKTPPRIACEHLSSATWSFPTREIGWAIGRTEAGDVPVADGRSSGQGVVFPFEVFVRRRDFPSALIANVPLSRQPSGVGAHGLRMSAYCPRRNVTSVTVPDSELGVWSVYVPFSIGALLSLEVVDLVGAGVVSTGAEQARRETPRSAARKMALAGRAFMGRSWCKWPTRSERPGLRRGVSSVSARFGEAFVPSRPFPFPGHEGGHPGEQIVRI